MFAHNLGDTSQGFVVILEMMACSQEGPFCFSIEYFIILGVHVFCNHLSFEVQIGIVSGLSLISLHLAPTPALSYRDSRVFPVLRRLPSIPSVPSLGFPNGRPAAPSQCNLAGWHTIQSKWLGCATAPSPCFCMSVHYS